MDNQQPKSPLAKKFDGFAPTGAYPRFENFQAKRVKKGRGIILLLSAIMLGIMVLGWANWLGETSERQVVQQQKMPINASSTNNMVNQTDSLNETLPTSTSSNEISAKDVTNYSIKSKKQVYQKKPKKIKSGNYVAVNSEFNAQNERSLPKFYLKPKPWQSFYEWIHQDIRSKPITCLAYVRDSATKKEHKSSFFVFSAGVNMATSELKMANNADDYIHPDFKKIYNQTQQAKTSMLVKSTLHIPIKNNFWIGTGLGFTSNHLGGEYSFKIDSVPVYDIDNTIAGFVVYPEGSPSKQVELGSAFRSYSFATIPVSISYLLTRPKWSLHTELGSEFSYLLSARGNSLDAFNLKQIVPIKSILNPEYFSVYGKLSIYKNITSSLALGLSISTNIQMNNLYNIQYFKGINQMTQFQVSTKFNLKR